ncbi:MAG: T9SS type A sorting domain-containing protein [Flavobacteriales bacterium]|nr:T9SS type A sorting domain-containing protein [Flavobacteriales bacterium]
MRSFLTLVSIVFSLSICAQTVLFSEDFETALPAFAPNTPDMGSVQTGDNTWLINNSYAGGSGEILCLGFPFSFTIPTTAAQPAGISMANGKYLHIASTPGIAAGITNCSFVAADGLCTNAANHFARMTQDVNTVGASDITVSFWWLCGGSASNYGEIYYSTNSGSSWTLVNTPISQYSNQSNWVEQTISDPAFAGHTTLRFGFRFVNNTTLSATDPAFGIDDVEITSGSTVANSISTGTIAPVSYCQGTGLNIPYTANGTYSAGNSFTAELSDATGSFAAPVIIGTVSSTTSGSIVATIPANTPVGTEYLVRVVSSTPFTVGTPFGISLSVSEAPFAGDDRSIILCKNSGTYDLLQLLTGTPSTCGTWAGPAGTLAGGMFNTATNNPGAYVYTTNCPSACPRDMATLTVTLQNPANAGSNVTAELCNNDPPADVHDLVLNGDEDGFFYYQGQSSPQPDLTIPGSYPLTYIVFGVGPCVNDTSDFILNVNEAPNAGASASATICTNATATELISLIGGTPDAGGTWTDPSGLVTSGILTPGTSVAGLYTYTVPGIAPCEDEQAFVAVVFDPCTGVEDQGERMTSIRWVGQMGNVHTVMIGYSDLDHYELIDATGRVHIQQRDLVQGDRILLDLAGQPTGIYFLRASDRSGQSVIKLLHRGS